MKIHNVEFFWHTIRVKPKTVLKSAAVSNEAEYPYRTSQSTVYRLWPLRRGLVIGKWEWTGRTEDEALRALLTTEYSLTGYEGSGVVFSTEEIREFN